MQVSFSEPTAWAAIENITRAQDKERRKMREEKRRTRRRRREGKPFTDYMKEAAQIARAGKQANVVLPAVHGYDGAKGR